MNACGRAGRWGGCWHRFVVTCVDVRNEVVRREGKPSGINDRQPACIAGQGCKRENDVTAFKSTLKIRPTEGGEKEN